jgi:phage/plasmid-associated DNA primase
MDVLGEFISTMCIENPEIRTATKELYQAYCNWCKENGEEPISARSFGRRLEERGYKSVKLAHGTRGWQGLGLRSTTH